MAVFSVHVFRVKYTPCNTVIGFTSDLTVENLANFEIE